MRRPARLVSFIMFSSTVILFGGIFVAVRGQPAGYQVQGYCGPDNGHCSGGVATGSWGNNCMCNPGTAGPAGYCCHNCCAGTFEPLFGQGAKGAYSANNQCIPCNPCASGSYAATVGAVSCTPCSAGSFSAAGASTCTLCANGQFSAPGSTSCTTCPSGASAMSESRSCNCSTLGTFFSLSPLSCSPCLPGSYSNTTAALSCTLCPAGTFSEAVGAASFSTCVPCAAGSSSSAGSTACAYCPPGQSSNAGGLCSPVSSCLPGFFSFSGVAPCVPCSPGSYSSLVGAQTCNLCPAGTFGSAAGLTSAACSGACSPASACPPGTAYPPPPPPVSSLSCASVGARAAPQSLGLLLWPAAHPANPQRVDLLVATLAVCQQLGGTCSTAPTNTIAAADGVTTLHIVGTAAALHLEAAEQLSCAAT